MTRLMLLASALAVATPALAAETHYEGVIRLVKVNSACVSTGGPHAGDRNVALFHPRAITGNGAYSSLTTFWGYGTNAGSLASANFDAALRAVDNRNIAYDPYDPRANVPQGITKISITSAQPSYNPPPLTVTLEGQIQNFWGDTTMNACIANYIFAGIRNN